MIKTIFGLFLVAGYTLGSQLPYYGEATYNKGAGSGVCGRTFDTNSEVFASLPSSFWSTGSNSDPLCSSKIRVKYNGKTIDVPVRDKCTRCSTNVLSLSAPAFKDLVGSLNDGNIGISWEFINGGMGGTSGGSGGGNGGNGGTCTRKAIVDAGQGCWDVWTTKCGNKWNENLFYQINPGTVCTALKIGQSLCCEGGGGSSPSSTGGGCTRKATVDAGQGCWDVWTSKCHNQWDENLFYQKNPGTVCTALAIGQSLCC
ncbi:hypothetical protein DICPUDRAFT_37473 [Dictyostelium purpureum]|uniref:Expansin-like EG45 domain-containing protein n=1 Tax=Dictyostelium purpureum TaxID=5786 RepID=F0ZSW7_DICPU|nr:uncharacterized protein DICPUDRAFT_37473 [Dictyostelium purpureum]EGC32950.1 hypothetical protein DICPUDRAFT_37473 [Dictyostelium purpureum]|eukprot:XP_003290516.1 hypothetical protein DICPUDRAFT_37473 [Dictyostelium purpureum]